MTPVAFALVLTGVLLNAAAQLLLKAGTNALGHIDFSAGGLFAIAPRVATEPHILGGLSCYVRLGAVPSQRNAQTSEAVIR